MTSRRSRGAVLVALASAIASALAGCGTLGLHVDTSFADPETSVAEATAERVSSLTPEVTSTVEQGVLTVGIDPDATSAPLLLRSESNTIRGLDVDMACALADELGLTVRFVEVNEADAALGTSCDVVMGTSDGDMDGSTVVGDVAESASAFFHKGDTGTAKVEDLSSKTVGVQEGSVSQNALAKTGLVMDVRTYQNLNEAFEALDQGEVDYVLCDAYAGAYLSESYADATFVGTLDAPVVEGVAVSSDNAELLSAVQQALQTIDGDGVGQIVRNRWVGGMDHLGTDTQVQNVPAASSQSGVTEGDGSATSDAAATTSSTASYGDARDGTTAGANAATV